MEMNDFRIINAARDKVWVALNDPAVLKQCVIGCDSLERQDDGTLAAAMSVRIGPVSAKFKGKITLQEVKPPQSYTLVFEGNGGAAGFAKGTANVALTEEPLGKTKLTYSASSQIGGKLAQVGSRLIDAAAKKIADDFFAKFSELVGGPESPAAESGDATNAMNAMTAAKATANTQASSRIFWYCGAALVLIVALIWALK